MASRDRIVALLIALAACGDNGVEALDGGGGALAVHAAEVVAIAEPVVDVVALDDGGFAVITIARVGGVDRLVLTRRDGDGGVRGGPVVLREYARPSADDAFGIVDSAVLDGDVIAVVWQLCAGPPSLSCSAEYATVSASGAVSTPVVLYDGIYGDVRVAGHRGLGQVLVLRTTTLDVRAGASAMILDEGGAVVQPWTRVGSSAARWGVAAASDAGFVIAVEDRYPGASEPDCPPCTTLPDCVTLPPGCASGDIESAAGIYARTVSSAGAGEPMLIASSWSDARYREPAYLSLTVAGRPALAEWSFGDRRHHLHLASEGGAWSDTAVALDDRAPAWTAMAADPSGGVRWLAAVAVLGPTLADTRTHFVGGILDDAGATTAATAETVSGFSFAGSATFERNGDALIAAGLVGAQSDWVGYDHYAVVRVRWTGQSPNQ